MTKIMLIDATHPEETRVAVVDGRKLEEFDVEVASRHPLKGNIYLAKVTRVEPSLQAAFVEYGGNRHGFLAFSEIHPDYYRIPVADREALMREDYEEAEAEDNRGQDRAEPAHVASPEAFTGESLTAESVSADSDPSDGPHGDGQENDGQENTGGEAALAFTPDYDHATAAAAEPDAANDAQPIWGGNPDAPAEPAQRAAAMPLATHQDSLFSDPVDTRQGDLDETAADAPSTAHDGSDDRGTTSTPDADAPLATTAGDSDVPAPTHGDIIEVTQPPEVIDTMGGEAPAPQEDDDESDDEDDSRRRRQRHMRRYKIQEVIKRRQILLVQVTKEERGNKGAALTTYLSLAGRYCVLMPNTDRGGGISRRITSVADRKRLKSIVDELDPPEGMAVIVRTAGMERQRSEIKRDFEYLLRLWDEIRETTLRSTAPALIYEEASLIKRSIRDLYTRDIGDIVVAGTDAYKSARSFMRMLAPAQAKRVQFYRDPSLPLFQRYQIESQIAAIHHPVVTLRSGGYIVINQTEALVAVDVNSGRSTRERNIEETALRTNLEAAEEVARQLRLRDLAGLIVIDFIDMDESRNNAAVERRIKDALRNDRARIQIGRISSFGLLEMSRQRLHASLQEASTEICLHCHGTGRMRSVDSTALHVLRMVEEEITRNPAPGVTVHVPTSVGFFILNQKRHALAQLELRRGVRIYLTADDELNPPDFRLDRIKQLAPGEELPPAPLPSVIDVEFDQAEEDDLAYEETDDAEMAADSDAGEQEDAAEDDNAERGQGRGRKRRRRRGRGGRLQADDFTEQASSSDAGDEDGDEPSRPQNGERSFPASERGVQDNDQNGDDAARGESDDGEDDEEASESTGTESDETRRRRRRGRRGGRRRSRRNQDEAASGESPQAAPGSGDQPEIPRDAGVLPPQWQANDANASADAVSDDDAAAGDAERGEKPRRQRRPRRPREDEVEAQVAAPETAPAFAAAERSAPAPYHHNGGEPAVAVTTHPASADDDQPKKRGWWRRLIE
jgi:ribonuclease E